MLSSPKFAFCTFWTENRALFLVKLRLKMPKMPKITKSSFGCYLNYCRSPPVSCCRWSYGQTGGPPIKLGVRHKVRFLQYHTRNQGQWFLLLCGCPNSLRSQMTERRISRAANSNSFRLRLTSDLAGERGERERSISPLSSSSS